jgi:hypothetical protein
MKCKATLFTPKAKSASPLTHPIIPTLDHPLFAARKEGFVILVSYTIISSSKYMLFHTKFRTFATSKI